MTEEQFEKSINRILKGDQDGLKDIYEAYLSYIYAAIYSVLQNRENAEDLTSEFFIKIWKIADKYRPGTGHKTWMTTIARNMAIDFLRKYKRETLTDEFFEGTNDESVESEVLGDITVEKALAILNENERQIVTMRIIGDMTFQEISNALAIPMGTVTWRYQNALKKLRRCGYE